MAIRMGPRERTRAAFIIYGILCFLFLYVPVILLAAFSFNESRAGNLPFTGLTLKWYEDLFTDYLVIDAFKNSVLVAAGTSVIATAIGTAAAFPLVRSRFRFKENLRVIFLLPMLLPG